MVGAAEMGQGEGTLSRAAGLVAAARQDFDALSRALEGQIAGVQGRWVGAGGTAFFALHRAWTEKQRVVTGALDAFEASLTSTERDNVATDETQSADYARVAGRLG
jgi:WXG100 family type VII secretion target